MTLYISIFLGLLALSTLKRQNGLFYILMVLAIAMGALRGETIGTDTAMYNSLYEAQSQGVESAHFEILFRTLYRILYILNAPIWLVQACVMLLTLIPITIVIKKNRVPPILSLFFFYALFGYLYSFNAQRQMIGVAFALLAYTYYPQKVKAAIFILIGMGFHTSAILAFLVFITPYLRLKPLYVAPLLLITFLGGFVMNDNILISILGKYSSYLTDSHLSKDFGFRDNIGYAAIMAAALTIIFIMLYTSATSELKSSKWFKLYFICILINNLSFKLVLGTRILIYFTMVQIILYPLLFKHNKEENPLIIKTILLLYVTVYFMKMMINVESAYAPYVMCI